MRTKNLLAILFASTLAGACTVHGRATTGGYASTSGELVYVGPGVYAVADYDEPVFYSDNSYWLYRDGGWYSSGYYTGGWQRARNVPRAVLRIERPRAYVHYRGDGQARRIHARDHRDQRSRRVYR